MNSKFRIEDNPEAKNVTQPVGSEPDPKIQLYIAKAITELKDSQTANFITILGIFASFLAFLIIEIQILKAVCHYLRILGFSLFILGGIFCFVTFLLYFIDSQSKKTKQMIVLTLISILLIVGGIFAVTKSEDEYVCQLNKLERDFQKLQLDLREENNKWIEAKTAEFDSLKASIKK